MMTPHSAQNRPAIGSTSQKLRWTPVSWPTGGWPRMFTLRFSNPGVIWMSNPDISHAAVYPPIAQNAT